MILTRRRFLQSVAASTLFVAPAIVRSESLMKIFVPGEPAARFRVPDLRGHIATDSEPQIGHVGPEMTATEVLQRREEVKARWTSRWQASMTEQNARQMYQAASTKAVNDKIDAEILNKLQGQEITGVWVDEAADLPMAYHIHKRSGEVTAFAGKGTRLEYVPCDGRELSSIEYPNLYQVLGNKYG
jgi:microcystin-dependent protein